MRKGQYRFVAGFLFVPVALYLIFVIWPYIQTFGYSLTDWKGQSQTFSFVGLDNYKALFQDDIFMGAIWHNVLFLVFIPVITILLALFFAFMLNAGGRSRSGGVSGVAYPSSTESSTSSRKCCHSRSSPCFSAPCTAATAAACSTAS